MCEPKVVQHIEIKGLAASWKDPVTATLFPNKIGNRVVINITEYEGDQK